MIPSILKAMIRVPKNSDWTLLIKIFGVGVLKFACKSFYTEKYFIILEL